MTSAYDHLMKILIIGDTSSSKRKLLGKYLQDKELTDTTTLGEKRREGGKLGGSRRKGVGREEEEQWSVRRK